MSRHLKTKVISGLKRLVSAYVPSPARSVIPARGVRYFIAVEHIKTLSGALNTVSEGRRYRKHIIVRRAPEHNGLLQLYTYHFPKTWSQACQDNRALIKLAQRQAHALEHDYSMAALEYRMRFFRHYFNVFRLHKAPEQGFKRYSRFYQYTFVAIYRELKAAAQASTSLSTSRRYTAEQSDLQSAQDITFEPVMPHRSLHSDVIRRSLYATDFGLFFPKNALPPCTCQKKAVSLHPI